jgi:hypothetical protein
MGIKALLKKTLFYLASATRPYFFANEKKPDRELPFSSENHRFH